MSLLYLVPFLELSPMGDGEFGPSTKYRLLRKIIQKLPHWTRRLPLLEVSRPYLLYIKESFWNGFSSDTGETLVSGSIVCTGLLQGTVHLGLSSLIPSPISSSPWNSSTPSAQRNSSAFLLGRSSLCPLFCHTCPSSCPFSMCKGESHSSLGHLACTSSQRSKELGLCIHTDWVRIPALPSLAVGSWGSPSPALESGTVKGPGSSELLGKEKS